MPGWDRSFKLNIALLHGIVLIWGFTGILGRLIEAPSAQIVWYRMAMAVPALWMVLRLRRVSAAVGWRDLATLLIVGLIVALHWVTFFEAIKVSNVSTALACMASTALFTALLEPIFYKRRIRLGEILLSLAVVLGLVLIFSFERRFVLGISLAITSAALAATFTVLNGRLVQRLNSTLISFYELGFGALAVTMYLWSSDQLDMEMFRQSPVDWAYLVFLGLICTAFAFVASVEIMRRLTPFTVSLTINLEPVYAILLALMIFGESEYMSVGFYGGAAIVLGTVLLHTLLRARKRTKTRSDLLSAPSSTPAEDRSSPR